MESLHNLLKTSPNNKNHDTYLKIRKYENSADDSDHRLSSNIIDNDKIKDEFKVEVSNDEVVAVKYDEFVKVTTVATRVDDYESDNFEVGDETTNDEPEILLEFKVEVTNDEVVEVNNHEFVKVTTVAKGIDDDDDSDHFEVCDETVNDKPEMKHDKRVIVNKRKSKKDMEIVKTKKSKENEPVPGSETIKKGTAEPW